MNYKNITMPVIAFLFSLAYTPIKAMEIPPSASLSSLLAMVQKKYPSKNSTAARPSQYQKRNGSLQLTHACSFLRNLRLNSDYETIIDQSTPLLIKELANCYAQGDAITTAVELGIPKAGEWLANNAIAYHDRKAARGELVEAILQKDIGRVNFLLKYLPRLSSFSYCQVDEKGRRIWEANSKQTLLLWAASVGATQIGAMLIDDKLSDVNERNASGVSSIIVAAANNHPQMIEMLASRKALMDAKDCGGRTALMMSAQNNNVLAVKALLCAGARTDVKDNQGKDAFCYVNRTSFYASIDDYFENDIDTLLSKAELEEMEREQRTLKEWVRFPEWVQCPIKIAPPKITIDPID